jgi:hypothetical protein
LWKRRELKESAEKKIGTAKTSRTPRGKGAAAEGCRFAIFLPFDGK